MKHDVEFFFLHFCDKDIQRKFSLLLHFEATMERNTTWSQFQVDFITTVDTYVAILQTTTYVIVVLIGVPLVLGIISYEHIGVDAKKRSIFNQLVSAFFGTMAATLILVGFFIAIRCWIGPLGIILGTILTFIRKFCFTSMLMITVEVLTYKITCLIKPQFILRLDADFWSNALIVWNGIFAFFINTTTWIILEQYPPMYLYL